MLWIPRALLSGLCLGLFVSACGSSATSGTVASTPDALLIPKVDAKIDVSKPKPDIGVDVDVQAPGTDATVDDGTGTADPCQTCLTDVECGTAWHCAQVQGGSYCAPDCGPSGVDDCGTAAVCVTVASGTGEQIQVCVPLVDVCAGTDAGGNPSGPGDGGGTGDASGPQDDADSLDDAGALGDATDAPSSTLVCGDLVGPDVDGCCKCATGKACATNGCYGGWFCNVKSCKCAKPPVPEQCPAPGSGSDAGSADASPGPDVQVQDVTDAGVVSCAGLDSPGSASCCKCATGKACAANGCYGGWFCNSNSCKCAAPPTPQMCGGADAGPTDAVDAAGADVPDAGGPVAGPASWGAGGGPGAASCCVCKAGKTCAANGCFGGWYCNHDTCKCQGAPAPSTCGVDAGSLDGGGKDIVAKDSVVQDAGKDTSSKDTASQDTGKDSAQSGGTSVGVTGGPLESLDFAIVGDTRPPAKDDLKLYPTAVITKIWTAVEAEAPHIAFAVTTGDYQFSKATGNTAAPQFDLYLAAQANYTGTVFHTMGNHECTGAVDSNCGTGNKDGTPQTYQTFMQKLMKPLGLEKPWYEIDFQAQDGSWTAKFVFVAANAWSSEQAAWLDKALAKPTTYTLVVRHEGTVATQAPGVTPSGAILKQHPYTLLLVGHTHTFEYFAKERQVVTGNGGAPLATAVNYGYVVVRQRVDKALAFHVYDYETHATIASFAVKPDGSPTP
jgi:hypothetical protein